MNILVTGGNGRMARHIQSTDKCTFFKPTREELNLESYDSIDAYLEGKNIEGLILNAFQYLPGQLTLDTFRTLDSEFLKATQVNLLSTLYLYRKLENSLKFIIFLSTGLDPKHENQHIFYRNNKNTVSDMLERLSYSENKVKTIFLHPGHMHDDFTFTQSALQVTKLAEKIDELDNLGTYGIFDKEKMRATKLASIKSYDTIGVVEL